MREVEAQRAAWRAHTIMDYRVRVAVECFCPWPSTPTVLEVRRGIPVALFDTLGRPAGKLREPWSAYTIEGMFDLIERSARRDDVVQVTFDPGLGYPTAMRGDRKLGQVDDWFGVRMSHLTRGR